MTRTWAFVAAAVVAVGIGGTFLLTQLRAPADRLEACLRGSVAGGDIGGPFTLVSETGETVTDADVITEPTLVYFGYT
ncbi:MAG: SCO family protein, partial [Pseudomonadota bacterium]